MADERLGASFSIDVSELKAGLKQANKLIRESESEFKAAAAGMDDWTKSEDGLKAKIKSLTDTTNVQREKVKALKEEYNRLIDEGLDPTSQQAVDLRTKINNEEAALKSNEKELEKQKEALKNLGDETDKSSEKFEKFGEVVKKVGEVAAVALAAAGAAVIALGKTAIESYAEYEQLVGGVDTLFKESSKTIQKYADEAYKTAGISSNQYMEQATSFSASLIQSLGGDTKKAAEYANKAIIDMSDNANKMGSDIESLQNAYQGFAKQNYTMLDNLKLGYGGTKEEMQRLIADANKLAKEQGLAGDLTIESYADVIEAIHLVQDEMGITGTTAKEAATTIQGSVGMMKAAWSNLMTGLADENANFDKLLSNLLESVGAVAENLIPRIKVVLKGIVKLIQELAPILMEELPEIFNEIMPDLAEGAMSLVQALGETLLSSIPELISLGAEMISKLAEGFGDNIPQLIEEGLIAIQEFADNLAENVGTFVDAGIALLMKLVEGIAQSIPVLIEYIPTLVSTIADIINDNAPKLLVAAAEMIWTLAKGLIQAIPTLIKNIPKIIKAIVKAWMAFQWANLGKSAIKGIKDGILKLKSQVTSAMGKIKSSVTGALKDLPSKMKDVGVNLIKGLWNGIKDMASWIKSKIQGFGKGVLNSLKDFFGIHSPSSVMRDEVGKYLGQGIGVGLIDSVKGISGKVNNALASETSKMRTNLNVNARTGLFAEGDGTSVGGGGVVVYQTNNYSQAHSRYEIYKSKQQTAAAVRLAVKGV